MKRFSILSLLTALSLACVIGCGGSSATKFTGNNTPTSSIEKEGKAATKPGEKDKAGVAGGGFKQGE